MSAKWQDNWELDPDGPKSRQGGQGSVRRVRQKLDGVKGALKELHEHHLNNTERRVRMQREVNALRAVGGQGAPKVYESNTDNWQDLGSALYTVMEWIEGRTLADHVNGRARTVDEGLEIVQPLLATMENCHRFDIHHRDLKPDNIMLRGGQPKDPVLVDFGLAWCRPSGGEEKGFETESGQQLGNRFLFLPEYGSHLHIEDPRSDLTMLVGVLFYVIAGEKPVALRDGNGKRPHERDTIPAKLRDDWRWKKLRGLFTVGFQERLDDRIQTPEKFRQLMASLEPPPGNDDVLAQELQRLDLIRQTHFADAERIGNVLATASDRFVKEFNRLTTEHGFQWYTGGHTVSSSVRSQPVSTDVRPVWAKGGISSRAPSLRIEYWHTLSYEKGEYVAKYKTEKTAGEFTQHHWTIPDIEYYRRSAVDDESLMDAVTAGAKEVFLRLISAYRANLEDGHPV